MVCTIYNFIKKNSRMKNHVLILLLLAFPAFLRAQAISINTDGSSADTSAILDVKSTEKGILIPRMDSMQRVSIPYPAAGLMVYEIGNGATARAFWYNAGTPGAPDWQRVGLRTLPVVLATQMSWLH